jgi:hypothetical protein
MRGDRRGVSWRFEALALLGLGIGAAKTGAKALLSSSTSSSASLHLRTRFTVGVPSRSAMGVLRRLVIGVPLRVNGLAMGVSWRGRDFRRAGPRLCVCVQVCECAYVSHEKVEVYAFGYVRVSVSLNVFICVREYALGTCSRVVATCAASLPLGEGCLPYA